MSRYGKAVYRYLVDWRDGDNYLDQYSDLIATGLYRSHSFSYGSTDAGGGLRELYPGRGRLTLWNRDNIFSTENPDSPFNYTTPEGWVRNRVNSPHKILKVRDDINPGTVVWSAWVYPPFEQWSATSELVTFELAHSCLYELRRKEYWFSNRRTSLIQEARKFTGGGSIRVYVNGDDRELPPFSIGMPGAQNVDTWETYKQILRKLSVATAADSYVDAAGNIVFQPLDVERTPTDVFDLELTDLLWDSRVIEPITDVEFRSRTYTTDDDWSEVGSGETNGPFANRNRWGFGDTGRFGGIAFRTIAPAEVRR